MIKKFIMATMLSLISAVAISAQSISIWTPGGDLATSTTATNQQLAPTGVGAGSTTLSNLTIDAKGRITTKASGTFANVIALWGGTCDVTTWLRGDGQCIAPAGGITGLANPSATIGLSAVNGSAFTAMRSDGAPALSQAIAPTWSAAHIWSLVGDGGNNGAININNTLPQWTLFESDAAANAGHWSFSANGGQLRMRTFNDANSAGTDFLTVSRSGTTPTALSLGGGANVTIPTPSSGTALDVSGVSAALALDVHGAGLSAGGTAFTVGSIKQDNTTKRGVFSGYDSSGQIGIIGADSAGSASTLKFYTYDGASWGSRGQVTGPGNWTINQPTSGNNLTLTVDPVSNNAIYFDVTGSANDFAMGPGVGGAAFGIYSYQASKMAVAVDTAAGVRFYGSVSVNGGPGSWCGCAYFATLADTANSYSGSFQNTTSSGGALLLRVENTGSLLSQIYYGGSVVGSISTDGTNTAYNTSSDVRLKEHVENSRSASHLIDGIKVRQFDWKSNDKHQDYGFVAQELYQTYPEAVRVGTDAKTDPWGVDYSQLVPLLVKEVQDLRKRVAELEAR